MFTLPKKLRRYMAISFVSVSAEECFDNPLLLLRCGTFGGLLCVS
jgi:hypothetical protein